MGLKDHVGKDVGEVVSLLKRTQLTHQEVVCQGLYHKYHLSGLHLAMTNLRSS